jgi:hypothetical protein
MIKAILLVLNPARTWDTIVEDNPRFLSVLLAFLLPLVVLTSAAEGYGLATWGKWIGQLRKVKEFTIQEVVAYESVQCVLALLLVFVGAKLVKSLGETFHGRHTFEQSFKTVAYGLSPMFLLRLTDAIPSMPWYVSWGIGIVLSLAVLYHGVPRVMQPDPPHAFGLYLVSALFLLMTSGVVRFITAWMLEGKFKQLDAILSDIATRLRF